VSIYDDNASEMTLQGYFVLPSRNKIPHRFVRGVGLVRLSGWTTMSTPLPTPQPDADIAIRLGGGVVAFDIDDDGAVVPILEILPASSVAKRGQRGETHFYRVDFNIPNENFYDGDKLVLQVLYTGRQTSVPPSTHPSGGTYRYINGHSLNNTAKADLPLITEADYRSIRERLLGLYSLTRTFETNDRNPDIAARKDGFDDNPCADLNSAALKNLPAWVPELGLYNCKRRSGRYPAFDAVPSFRPSTTGRPLEERKRNLGIVGSGIKDFGTGKSYSPLDLVIVTRSCSLAEAFCWLEEKLLPQKPDVQIDLDKIIEAQDAPPAAPEEEPPKESAPKRRRINPMPLILPSEKDVPRRDFLYGMHYMRGTVSGTIGTGGTGKSTLGLIETIGMAVGRDLLGVEKFKKPLRVWYHNAEETMEELTRRCVAICKHYNISQDDLGNNLLITNGFETPIKVAGGGRDVKIDGGLRKEIIDVIDELGIDVAIFDPLVAMHRIHEDFNSALDPVIRDAFGKIAHDTNCAIDLCHHTRKKPAGHDGEYTVADSRGGQSLIDALRGARVLNTMSKTEAATFDIEEDERFDYMKLSRGKANMVRRGVIGWYQFRPVELLNGSEDEGVQGDIVAVLKRWYPPKEGDLVRAPTYEDRQFLVGALQYGEYRYDARSPDWFGFKIAERLGADKKDPRQMKVVTAILDDLIEEGTFKIEEKRDDKRRPRQFVVPGVVAGVESL